MRRCAGLLSSLIVSRSSALRLSPRIMMAASTPTKSLSYRTSLDEGVASPLQAPTILSPIKPTSVARVAAAAPEWHDLDVAASELRPCASLATGQCFNWRPVQFGEATPDGDGAVAWVGVVGHRVVALRETPTTTLFACLADQVRTLPRAIGSQTTHAFENAKARSL